ncbi:hypothetical protein ACIGEP_09690 [Microbacterium sp. NPDC077663]|uniref:hypothetical protein n=1 Tax=Microbacterium sp. NPDC077663 TaxID=3364189 RepID=UPI0037C91D53
MPFRSRETLERWVDEFHEARGAGERIKVIVQDGTDGDDTGLVIVPLENATVTIFMQPVEVGSATWSVTIEPHPDSTTLSSFQLHGMAVELSVAAELCAYLEARSVGHEETSGD